jgi:hypothetical protein
MASMKTVSWQTPLSSEALSPLLQSEVLPLAEPTPEAWGYYLEIGRGMGYFSWFPDRTHMLRHLGHVEVLHLPTLMPEREHYEALVDQLVALLSTYVQALASHDPQAGTALVEAYGRAIPDLNLRWVGQSMELREAKDAFAIALQQDFLTAEGKGVAEASPEQWLTFLAHYGI